MITFCQTSIKSKYPNVEKYLFMWKFGYLTLKNCNLMKIYTDLFLNTDLCKIIFINIKSTGKQWKPDSNIVNYENLRIENWIWWKFQILKTKKNEFSASMRYLVDCYVISRFFPLPSKMPVRNDICLAYFIKINNFFIRYIGRVQHAPGDSFWCKNLLIFFENDRRFRFIFISQR